MNVNTDAQGKCHYQRTDQYEYECSVLTSGLGPVLTVDLPSKSSFSKAGLSATAYAIALAPDSLISLNDNTRR